MGSPSWQIHYLRSSIWYLNCLCGEVGTVATVPNVPYMEGRLDQIIAASVSSE
jgi:hypothetical protein